MHSRPVTVVLIGMALISTLLWSGAASATPVGFNLVYTETSGGSSAGSGSVTIDDSFLTAHQSLFTAGGFISSFALTFTNTGFAGNDTVNFDITDIGAGFLLTDSLSVISNLSIWTYDRIGLAANTCPSCTDIYLAGVGILNATLTDPNSATVLNFGVAVTPVPEPNTALLLGFGLVVASASRRRSQQS